MILIQTGKSFYELKLFKKIKDNNELKVMLESYDVRLLKEDQNE